MAYVQCTDTPFLQSGIKIYRITDDTAGGTVVTLKWNTSSLPYGLCHVKTYGSMLSSHSIAVHMNPFNRAPLVCTRRLLGDRL